MIEKKPIISFHGYDVGKNAKQNLREKLKKSRWYAIPPYRNEGWQIRNEQGELVATFEMREDCLLVAELYNQTT